MSTQPFQQLITQLGSSEPEEFQAAHVILLGMDEDAINPLIDAFYSGVNETGGLAVLELVAQIGGPDALSLLRNVFGDQSTRELWRQAAAVGLLYNVDDLSEEEADAVLAYTNI